MKEFNGYSPILMVLPPALTQNSLQFNRSLCVSCDYHNKEPSIT